MIRLAIVGTGSIAGEFAAAARQSGQLAVAAVYSRRRETGEAFAARHCPEAAVLTDWEALCASEVEAVYIASPNGCHYAQSRAVLKSGKHVLCEKTITADAAQFRELSALAAARGLVYMDAIMSLHAASRPLLRQAVAGIGRIAAARLDFCQRSSRYDRMMRGERVNVFDMSLLGGTLMDLGVYCVYAAVDLFGEPQRVTASAHFLPNGTDIAGTAVLRYDGFDAVLTYSKAAQSARGSEILGDGGTVTLDSVSQYAGIARVQNGQTTPLYPIPSKVEIMTGEAADFAAYIRGERLQEYAGATAITQTVLRCMDDIKQSAGIRYKEEAR